MLQKIISLLFILTLLVSADVVTQEYAFTKPFVKDGIAYCNGCRASMDAFGPQVAVYGSKVMLPLGQQAKTITIQYGNLIEVAENYHLEPYLPAYSKKGDKKAVRRDMQHLINAIYQKDELFPGIKNTRANDRITTQFLGGVPIAVKVLTPVQYNPVREKLSYFDKITISIETEPVNPERDVAAYVGTPFSKSRIYQIVDNKEAVKSLPITPKAPDDYEFLVVTFPDIINSWTPFVEFNTRRGMRTKVMNISDIQQNGTGRDLAEKVRNTIKDEYEQHKIIFVALGGDVASGSSNIPCRQLYAEFYDHNKTPDRYYELEPASDLYFGTLDGNWDNDNDATYGEVGEEDMFWEVFVSRMPCDNATHLSNMINKTVKYSEQPVKENACNFLGLGEFLWNDYGVDVWGAMEIDLFIGYKTNNGYNTYGITDNFDITRLDDRTNNAASSWNSSDLTTTFNQSKPAWVDHVGHGNQSIAFGISSSQIASVFRNNGTTANYFVGITGACSPGKFHSTSNCFMEMLVTTEQAAVGAIGSCEYALGDDDGDNGPTARPFRYCHDALFNSQKRVHFFEAMHAMGKEANVDIITDPDAIDKAPYYGTIRYTSYNSNLFGEPALSVWTDTPKDLSQTFEYTANATQFTMKTPPYTMVALADVARGEIFSAQLTGYQAEADNSFDPSDSTCLINDDAYKTYAASNSKVKVYIKAHNYIAKSFDLDISTGISNTYTNGIQKYSVIPVKGHVLINFSLPANEQVNLSVYNSKGALVKTLMDGNVTAGNQFVKVDNNELSNGIYYCKIKTKSAQSVESFIITK